MTREYTTMDKSSWGTGPWDSEPDKLSFIDEATGLDCLIVRNDFGALCGYVGVPPEHPWHGVHYGYKPDGTRVDYDVDDDWCNTIDSIIDVHGGLTYSDSCQEDAPEAEGICHVLEPGRPADVYWFGFDCGHFMDFSPGLHFSPGLREEALGLSSYKDVEYVKEQCYKLAQQLAEVKA